MGNWSTSLVPVTTTNVTLASPAASNSSIALSSGAVANGLTVYADYSLSGNTLTLSDRLWLDSIGTDLTLTNTTVTAPSATIGVTPGSGTDGLSIGAGATLTIAGTVNVGYDGTSHQLTVNPTGIVSAASLWIGGSSVASGNSTSISGTLSTTTSLIVGYAGPSNSLTLATGGTLNSAQGIIGNEATADNNSVTVNSTVGWTNSGSLSIGLEGAGNSLSVSGGKVTTAGLILGEKSGASNNTLNVTAGGTLTSSDTRIGLNSGSDSNIATVSGANSLWTINGTLRVGSNGDSNQINIDSGGKVSASGNVFVGYLYSNSGSNSITVSGVGSTLELTGVLTDLVIGGNSELGNKLIVAAGGTVNATSIQLGPQGRLQIGAGAAAGNLINGSTVNGNDPAPSPGLGGTLSFKHSDASYTFNPSLTGPLQVVHEGSGKTVITGTQSYTGATTVDSGTLQVNGSIATSAVDITCGM